MKTLNVLHVDPRWHLRPAPATGRGTGTCERRSGAAVGIQTNIMEGLEATDLHMSAADLSATATAPRPTVGSALPVSRRLLHLSLPELLLNILFPDY